VRPFLRASTWGAAPRGGRHCRPRRPPVFEGGGWAWAPWLAQLHPALPRSTGRWIYWASLGADFSGTIFAVGGLSQTSGYLTPTPAALRGRGSPGREYAELGAPKLARGGRADHRRAAGRVGPGSKSAAALHGRSAKGPKPGQEAAALVGRRTACLKGEQGRHTPSTADGTGTPRPLRCFPLEMPDHHTSREGRSSSPPRASFLCGSTSSSAIGPGTGACALEVGSGTGLLPVQARHQRRGPRATTSTLDSRGPGQNGHQTRSATGVGRTGVERRRRGDHIFHVAARGKRLYDVISSEPLPAAVEKKNPVEGQVVNAPGTLETTGAANFDRPFVGGSSPGGLRPKDGRARWHTHCSCSIGAGGGGNSRKLLRKSGLRAQGGGTTRSSRSTILFKEKSRNHDRAGWSRLSEKTALPPETLGDRGRSLVVST